MRTLVARVGLPAAVMGMLLAAGLTLRASTPTAGSAGSAGASSASSAAPPGQGAAMASGSSSAAATGSAAPSVEPSSVAPSAGPVGQGPGEAERKAQAQALLSEGNQLAAEGEFGEGLDKFRAAYELFPATKLLLNIGTSLRHVGRNAEAAATYEQYLGQPDADPRRLDELHRILGEIDQLTGRIRLELPDKDARVHLDGRALSAEAWSKPLRVDPGEHTLVVEKPGYVTIVRTVSVKMREELKLALTLLKPGQAPPVVIEAGAGNTQRVVSYVLGGVGIAGLAAGAIFGGLALDTNSRAADHCMADNPSVCDADGASLGSTATTQGTLSTVFLIAGGALAVTGVVVWLTAPSDEAPVEPGAPSVALVLGPASGLRAAW